MSIQMLVFCSCW